MTSLSDDLRSKLQAAVGAPNLIESGETLETLSKDFYWYSPVLKPKLEDKKAAAIVRPGTLEELKAVVSACAQARVPVVPRGAGTGNYGQCVPLYGGVVVDLSRFDKILSIEDGVLRAEAGARMGTIETEARAKGWELRCMPSTWVKCTLGGFFCGGSGGVGSITWGGINGGDNVKSVTILSCEENPVLVKLEERESLKALHTYGTTGLMVEIEMRLAPKVDYEQLAISGASFDALLTWSDAFARRIDWKKRLVTFFEDPIPSFYKPMAKAFKPGEHVTFILVDRNVAEEVLASAQAAGLSCVWRKPLSDPPKPPFLTDFTWNHTTLWAIKADPSWTYLQAGFGPQFKEQFRELQRRFPGEIYFHLEWTAGNAKMMKGGSLHLNPDAVVVGGIPLVRYRSEERLNEILRACEELGVFIANPHTFYLEEGGRHPNIAEKRDFKAKMDPHALLNPGKMKTYPINPFVEQPAGA